MRILAMTNLYPNPFQPHRATFNRHQFRILGQQHPVQVIAPIAWTDEYKARRGGASPLPPDRRVVNDNLVVDHPRYYYPPKVARGYYGCFFLASVNKTFRRAFQEFSPELIFTPWAYPDGWAAVRLGESVNRPVVIQVHGSDVLLLDETPSRRKPTIHALRKADGIVAVSHNIASRLKEMGVEESKVRVIHDGVDHSLFAPGDKARERERLGIPSNAKFLLFVGNLVPVKAVDVLLRACSSPIMCDVPFELAIVGQGSLRVTLEKLARELGIDRKVKFHGTIPQVDLPRWYRAADVFILPSHSEGVPNVLLEASACGTPWVASRVGGIPEIAHLGTSRLVAPNTPAELSEAVFNTITVTQNLPPMGPKRREEAVDELIDFLKERLRSPQKKSC
jgi:glycosyltransferase involved in cell wall biosynthesis